MATHTFLEGHVRPIGHALASPVVYTNFRHTRIPKNPHLVKLWFTTDSAFHSTPSLIFSKEETIMYSYQVNDFNEELNLC